MKKEIKYIEIPDKYQEIIGTPDPGTRLYRAFGSQDEFSLWSDAVFDICSGSAVSPGGASLYVHATRAGVHKRLKEGRLTGFLFNIISDSKFIKGRKKLDNSGRSYCYIPYSECVAWAHDLKEREQDHLDDVLKEARGTKADWDDSFTEAPKDWRKRLKKKGGETNE